MTVQQLWRDRSEAARRPDWYAADAWAARNGLVLDDPMRLFVARRARFRRNAMWAVATPAVLLGYMSDVVPLYVAMLAALTAWCVVDFFGEQPPASRVAVAAAQPKTLKAFAGRSRFLVMVSLPVLVSAFVCGLWANRAMKGEPLTILDVASRIAAPVVVSGLVPLALATLLVRRPIRARSSDDLAIYYAVRRDSLRPLVAFVPALAVAAIGGAGAELLQLATERNTSHALLDFASGLGGLLLGPASLIAGLLVFVRLPVRGELASVAVGR